MLHGGCAFARGAAEQRACDLRRRHAHGAGIGLGRSLEIMTTQEKAAGSAAYTTFAAILMVCLLTFGTLHTFGVFR
jgi:hypothetical protein